MNVNTPVIALRIAGTIFGVVSLAHLLRLVVHADIVIAGYAVPGWMSAAAFVVAGALSLWMWRLSAPRE
ncbi:MAG: hypothetical protein HYY48_03825 [Gammaproteobacteria bacterium]|nr:hypothetical protein [Gammaproteobacteria bacterium]